MQADRPPQHRPANAPGQLVPSRSRGEVMSKNTLRESAADTVARATGVATREAGNEVMYLHVPGGRIAYEVAGQGPLIVLSHGIGDLRQSYRFLSPLLVRAGYRIANADLRGHGDSSIGFESVSRSDVAGDLLGPIRHLGGPAVIVGIEKGRPRPTRSPASGTSRPSIASSRPPAPAATAASPQRPHLDPHPRTDRNLG